MAGQKSIFVDFKGLFTSPGRLKRPLGSFAELQNFDLRWDGTLRKREGLYSSCVGGAAGVNYPWTGVYNPTFHKILPFDQRGTVICSAGDCYATDQFYLYSKSFDPTVNGTLVSTTAEGWVANAGSRRETTSWNYRAKMTAAQLGESVYFTTGVTTDGGCVGVARYDLDLGTYYLRPAGVGSPLSVARAYGTGAATSPGTYLAAAANRLLPDDSAVAYRFVIVQTLDNGTEKLSAPSGRHVIRNEASETGYVAATTADVVFNGFIPGSPGDFTRDMSTSGSRFKVLLFRTTIFPTGVEPDDRMFLCYERYLSAAELTARVFQITDSLPDSLLGEALYTNSDSGNVDADNVSGLLNANSMPPAAVCVESWQNRLWYGQVVGFETAEAQIVARIVAGNTVVLTTPGGTAYTYTCQNPPVAARTFQSFPALGILQDIERTAQSLCAAINYTSKTTGFYAHYIGTGNSIVAGQTAPGRILIRYGTFSMATTPVPFQIAPTPYVSWMPYDGTGATIKSKSERGDMTVYFSKPGNGDAVPPVNFLKLGSDNNNTIICMKAMSEGLYVFTTAGLFIVTGRGSSFGFDLVDPTCVPLNRELVTVLDETIYTWTVRGICAIRNGNIQYVSDPIKDQLDQDIRKGYGVSSGAEGLDRFKAYVFACADSRRGKVFFFKPDFTSWSESAYAKYAYVYEPRIGGVWSTFKTATNGVKSNIDVASGCELQGRAQFFLSEFNSVTVAPGTPCALLSPLDSINTADYDDYYGTSTTPRATALVATLNFQSPQIESKVFWQELHILWETSDTYTAVLAPTAITLTFTADDGSVAGQVVAPVVGSKMTRVIVPTWAKESTRLKVKLQRGSTNESFGIEGLVLWYTPGSKETIK